MNRIKPITFLGPLVFVFLSAGTLVAAIQLTLDIASVSLPISIASYNTVTGAATVTATTAQTLSVVATNRDWTLSVRALTNSFSFAPSSGDPNPSKPASDLSVRAPTMSNVYIPLTTSAQVLNGAARTRRRQDVPLDYRLRSNLASDPPGTYSLTIVYTAVED